VGPVQLPVLVSMIRILTTGTGFMKSIHYVVGGGRAYLRCIIPGWYMQKIQPPVQPFMSVVKASVLAVN